MDKIPWPIGNLAISLSLEIGSPRVLVKVDMVGGAPLERRSKHRGRSPAMVKCDPRLVDVKTDFLEAIIQHPQPIQEFRLVRDNQRGAPSLLREHLELVEIHRRAASTGATAHCLDGPVPLVHDDADAAAVGAALLALPETEVGGALVRAEVEIVDVVLAGGAGCIDAGPY